MLPSILMLLVVIWIVRELILMPAQFRLIGWALLCGLPILGGVLLFTIARRNESMTLDRDTYGFVGGLGGWIVGAVLFYATRRDHRAPSP
jgi:hypothetical protein